jgi:hypothetical protein
LHRSIARRCTLVALGTLLLAASPAQAADPPFRSLDAFERMAVTGAQGNGAVQAHKVYVTTAHGKTVSFVEISGNFHARHLHTTWSPGAASLAVTELTSADGPARRLSVYPFPSGSPTRLDTELDPVRSACPSGCPPRLVGRSRWVRTAQGVRLLAPVSQAGVVSINPDGTSPSVLPHTAGRGDGTGQFGNDVLSDGRLVRLVSDGSIGFTSLASLAVDVFPTGQTRVTQPPSIPDATAIAVSPDGRQIAYVTEEQLAVVGLDGTGRQTITPNLGIRGIPAWRPDGSRIGFLVGITAAGEAQPIYSVKPDGSDLVRHTTLANDSVNPNPMVQFGSDFSSLSWGRTCITFVECAASLSVINEGPVGFSIQSTPKLPAAASIGFLIERYSGRRLRQVGRVPFGRKARGRARVRWGLRLDGRRLRPGRYRISLRAVAGKVPLDVAKRKDLIVRRKAKPRLARPRVP